MPTRPLVLSLDIGTSSLRAIVFDAAAKAVRGWEAHRPYHLRTTPDGGVEGDPQHLVALAAEAIDRVLARMGGAQSRLAGVALSTFWHGLMAVGGDLQPLTPLYTWADTRSRDAAATLRRRLDEAQVHARTGCMLRSSYLPAKLLWVRRHQPGVSRRARCWISIGEYLLARLFGPLLTSVSMASGTGLLQQRTMEWDRDVLQAVGLSPDHLPPIAPPGQALTDLRPAFARRWPALAGVPWWPALGDGACSNLGAGAAGPGRIAIMIGTSGAIRMVLPAGRFRIPKGLWVYRLDHRRILMGGALSNGGNVVEWLDETVRLGPPATWQRALMTMPPDAHGLTVLPLLAGERNPHWADHARGAVSGLTLSTRPLDLLRAGMEAICYPLAVLEPMLARAHPGRARLIATGAGLLRSPAWIQILADVLGKPVTASLELEGSSRGAALMALESLGLIRDVADAHARFGRTYRPAPHRHAIYQRAIVRQRALYHVVIETGH